MPGARTPVPSQCAHTQRLSFPGRADSSTCAPRRFPSARPGPIPKVPHRYSGPTPDSGSCCHQRRPGHSSAAQRRRCVPRRRCHSVAAAAGGPAVRKPSSRRCCCCRHCSWRRSSCRRAAWEREEPHLPALAIVGLDEHVYRATFVVLRERVVLVVWFGNLAMMYHAWRRPGTWRAPLSAGGRGDERLVQWWYGCDLHSPAMHSRMLMIESAEQMPRLTQTACKTWESVNRRSQGEPGAYTMCARRLDSSRCGAETTPYYSPGRGGNSNAKTPRKMSAEHMVIGVFGAVNAMNTRVSDSTRRDWRRCDEACREMEEG